MKQQLSNIQKQLQNHKDNVNIVEVNEASPTSEDLEDIFSLRNSWCLHVHFNYCDLNPSNTSKSTHLIMFSTSQIQVSLNARTSAWPCAMGAPWAENVITSNSEISSCQTKARVVSLYGIYIWPNGIIFHQPRFPWFIGDSRFPSKKLPCWSCLRSRANLTRTMAS